MSRKRPEREKKRETKAAEQAVEEAKPKGFKASWEFRSARLALRIVGVLFFIGYLCLTSTSAWQWIQTKWVMHYPLEALPQKADYYLNRTFEPQKLFKFVSMRPVSETEKIIKLLEPYTARLSTYTFLHYSMRMKALGKNDEALFWWQFARYRGRFDALRCGSNDAKDTLDKLFALIPHPDFPPEASDTSSHLMDSIKKVLDLDAHYPADNIPEDMCDPLRSLEKGNFASVGIDRWADIRYTLRYMTEISLRQMAKDLKEGKKPGHEKPSWARQMQDDLKKAMRVADCNQETADCKSELDTCTARGNECERLADRCKRQADTCKKLGEEKEPK